MLPRYRHRRGPYALAEPSPGRRFIRRLIALAIVVCIVYSAGKWMLSTLGVGNNLERKSIQLDVENRSNVTVSLEGGLMQRPDGRLKLWPDDRIVSNASGHATLTFFDGTIVRLDEQSEVLITESSLGTKQSQISSSLVRGALWTRTPGTDAFSGSITRVIATKLYEAVIPSDADVVLGERSVLVFNADGDGVEIEADGAESVFIGEGQQFVVPEDESFTGNLRRFRSAMDPMTVRRAFIEESRTIRSLTGETPAAEETTPSLDLVTIETPVNNQSISGSTVRVQGRVGARIERVRVNGYPATINRGQSTYAQELAMPGTDTFTIRVEALDRTGVIVEQQERVVKAGSPIASASPSITTPGKNGETVRTPLEEFDIRGTAPTGASAIYVNDYKLQLFRAGDSDWSYLASTRLGNLKRGENIFSVIAETVTGGRSAPAILTIIVGEAGPTTSATTSSAPAVPVVSESTLPTNAPLSPGTIAVTSPSGGTNTTYAGTGFLLEGTTSKDTASMWVNGYQLKLYTPGKAFWNYWATAAYGTLKPGTNVYRIVSRNAKNEILDIFTYTVEYTL